MSSETNSATARERVVLPAIPGEQEAAQTYPAIELQRSYVDEGRLIFERPGGFDRALTQGFFLVRFPSELDPSAGDLFAEHFHEAPVGDDIDRFRGFRDVAVPGDYQGYFDREHDQWENFYIELENWNLLPEDVARVGHGMTDLGITILRNVLNYLSLPTNDWPAVTSGLTEKQGHQMLAFNHFRPEKNVRGSKFHRDSGWVTVLRSVEPGLLALIEDRLWAVNPEPGYFVANFGSSIEVLTERLARPVRASIHGVARTQRARDEAHRWSYVTFLDSKLSGDIYRYEDGRPRFVQTVAEFAVQEVSRTYDDNNEEL